MELVRGIRITDYCDQHQLPTQERLDCSSRSARRSSTRTRRASSTATSSPRTSSSPCNDGVPVPKVIDFGIAKATQQELTDKTVFTQFQQFIGTPAYISPEQAEMSSLDIDTRADIYSLGVLLYELLVGQTPFDAKEMMQGGLDALRQDHPGKGTAAALDQAQHVAGGRPDHGGQAPADRRGQKLVHQLEGDLDWIVMKCLEKDRTRRYDTANGLAMDIQRYLHLTNEPVLWWAGAAPQGRAELDQLAEEFRQRGPTADVARARTLRLLGYTLISMDKPLESEAPLSEAYRLEPSVGEIYCRALILNGKYPQAEKVARAAVSRVHADLAKPGTRKAFDEFKAGLGAVDSYAAFAEVLVRLGRFDEAETLLAEQLGPAAAVWSPAQLKTLKHLQLGVQACSGGWREAAPGVIALATNAVAELYDWTCGITAAVAIGDTNAHARLDRWGRARYIGNAEVETADLLVWSILLRPGQDDLSVTVPDLLSRIEEAKDYHWTAINLPLLRSQLAYRKGEYEDALRFLDAWVQSKDERPMNASFLHTFRSLPIAEFWRAMILAGLGRPEEAGKAYADGVQKTRAGIATHLLVFEPYYAMALQQEAREVFRSRGMAVPDR
jgi:tetratricopeptide (TPR) repeat protein